MKLKYYNHQFECYYEIGIDIFNVNYQIVPSM